MKKTLRMMGLCALAVLALAGCKKDEQTTSTIKATLTQPTGNAKTHIGNALYLVWDADDDIIVYTKDKTESATFSLTAGAETPNATFSGSIAGSDSITAFYPKEGVDVTGEGKFVLPMSGSQTYKTNSFDTKTYPMCATAKVGDDLEFHSPYGLLGLQLKGSATVGSIELTGNNNEDLVGHYEIGSDTVFVANGEKTITLTFGTGGLVLDENTIDTVYFVLPAGVFAGGFTAVVKNTTNDIIDNLTTTNNNTIRRERIRMMSPKTLAEVQTEDPSAITSNSVTLHGSVVYEGPVGDIQAHGFSYSTTPDFEGSTGTVVPVTDWDTKGTYTFHKVLESLPANTHFYYRAYFNLTLDPATMEYGGIKEFTTTEQTYTITVSANPSAAGIVGGAGTYTLGQSHTVTATANPGYAFVNWTEGSNVVSTNASYEFNIEGNRSLVANFVATYTIAATANPTDGGTVTGGGPYNQGASCTLTATANEGYTFTNWTEGGTVVSTNANYQFTVTGNRTLQANFVQQHTITATANPTDGGSVTGGGTYNQGASCTLTAAANEGYTFINWTEDGTEVSTNANYQFTVTGNRTLQANFAPAAPVGAIGFPFSVNETQQMYFSKGNLQYQASTGTWRFAEHQWDYVGGTVENWNGTTTEYGTVYENGVKCSNNEISQTYSGWIDLFGWGTSGYNHGAICYQPWSTSMNYSDYYAYGQYTYNLYDQTGQADWGCNAIANGGNQENSGWRTLTNDELYYILYERDGFAEKKGHGNVNGVNGIILLPDAWTLPDGLSFTSGNSDWANVYFGEQWTQMEANGAVFFPAANRRKGTGIQTAYGYYWMGSQYPGGNLTSAYNLFFQSGACYRTYSSRYYGFSVRLVRNVE